MQTEQAMTKYKTHGTHANASCGNEGTRSQLERVHAGTKERVPNKNAFQILSPSVPGTVRNEER